MAENHEEKIPTADEMFAQEESIKKFLKETAMHIDTIQGQRKELKEYADKTIELIHLVEKQRERIKELERNRVVSEMAGGAAHSLNQPLAVVQGYVEMMLRETDESSDDYRRLKTMHVEIVKMGDIVKKLREATHYVSREYIGGQVIVDLDKLSDI